MTYLEHVGRLADRAMRLVDEHPTDPQHVSPLVREAVRCLESGSPDRSYEYFTASLGLMYRWAERIVPVREESGFVVRLERGVDRERSMVERALTNRYDCYPIALTGHAFADLLIASAHDVPDLSERKRDISGLMGKLTDAERERAVRWIPLLR
jgi:hypothetical protein